MSDLIQSTIDDVTASFAEAMICSESSCPDENMLDAAAVESVETQPTDRKKRTRKKYHKKANSRMQIGDDNLPNQTSDPDSHVPNAIVAPCAGGFLLTATDGIDGLASASETLNITLVNMACVEEKGTTVSKGMQSSVAMEMPQLPDSELPVEKKKLSKSARKRKNSKAKAELRLNANVDQPVPIVIDGSLPGVVQPVTVPVQDEQQQQSKYNAKKPNKNQKPVSLKQNHADQAVPIVIDGSLPGMVQPVTVPVQDERQQQSKCNAKKPNKNQKPVSLKQNHAAGQPNSQNSGTQPPVCKQEKPLQNKEVVNSNNRKGYGMNRITPLDKPFEEYWNAEDVQHGLKRAQLIQGPIRINQRNYEECFVLHTDGKSDVCITGMHDRNRALNGDIVCVMVNPKEQWKTLIEDLNEMENYLVEAFGSTLSLGSSAAAVTNSSLQNQSSGARDRQPPGSGTPQNGSKMPNSSQRQKQCSSNRYTLLKDIGRNQDSGSLPISPVIKNLFSNNRNGSARSTVADLENMERKINLLPEELLVRTGKVVYIVEKVHSRASVGRIKPVTDKKWPNTAFFSPNDSRLPRILVDLSYCPAGFSQRPEDFENTLFIARITNWERNMPFAQGCLARSLGEAGEIEPETEGMLIEYELDFGDFSDDVLTCLPEELPWTIPAKEFEYRRDLRKECIFTIDPATARDLDDALSCRPLEPGFFEVGVHIADVSFFVKPDTSLDAVAAHRCTSVYLVQKVIPMLPRLLCEELCSLNAGEDRLCFSVIWKMTENGEIADEWFGRTVINSCVKLSYEHAQGFIAEPNREWTAEELPPITGGFTIDAIRKTVLDLNRIAVIMRKRRFDGGALRLDQVKLQFSLNKETGMPDGWYVYEQRDSNRLVEEFMLLANMATAHRIKSAFPKFAVLRRHPEPKSRMLESVISICESLGVTIDGSSAGALQRSLYTESGSGEDAQARLLVLTSLCSRPMKNALYFCTGVLENEEEYAHYALNVPLYTHFTSPIRRYPDIMVHRLLAATLLYSEQTLTDARAVEQQCLLCNKRKTSAKRVSEMSAELFFGIFLKHCGTMDAKGMVMSVLDKSFDVLILSLGIVKRAYCEKMPLQSFKASKVSKRPQLELVWKADEQHPAEIVQEVTIFTPVSCQLVAGDDALRWNLEIKHPLEPYL